MSAIKNYGGYRFCCEDCKYYEELDEDTGVCELTHAVVVGLGLDIICPTYCDVDE